MGRSKSKDYESLLKSALSIARRHKVVRNYDVFRERSKLVEVYGIGATNEAFSIAYRAVVRESMEETKRQVESE